jgi:hypothetical protein
MCSCTLTEVNASGSLAAEFSLEIGLVYFVTRKNGIESERNERCCCSVMAEIRVFLPPIRSCHITQTYQT